MKWGISSAFPFKEEVYYLPLPVLPYHKKVEAKFVSKDDFERLIAGDEIEIKSEKLPYNYHTKYLICLRTTANTNIYYDLLCKFEKNSGLYFLVDGNGKKLLEPALRYLEDEGIGGKRTWGLGRFEHEWVNLEIKTPSESNAFITLSLTFPKNLNSVIYWKPVIRGGWTLKGKQIRKPRIIMASEGSIFRSNDDGQILDLDDLVGGISARVGHKVFVNGKSFLIPMVMGYGD